MSDRVKGPFAFQSDYANECVRNVQYVTEAENLKTPFRVNIRGNGISVNPELLKHLGEMNPAGQTLAYVLLRFAKDDKVRSALLEVMSLEVLFSKNAGCDSPAFMGFLWGERENPRIEYGVKSRSRGTDIMKTPISDIFRVLIDQGLTMAHLKIANTRNETCLGFAKIIAAKDRHDEAALEALLAPLHKA